MDNRAGEMQVFLAAIELGSFSAAGRRLMMTPSTVSKLVARIEDRVGVRLIDRSTRRLSLTAEGQLYHERARSILEELDELDRNVASGGTTASGTVRLNASVAFGTIVLEPMIPPFLLEHPRMQVDLSLSEETIDLYAGAADIVFRVGGLTDSNLTSRAIGTVRRRIVAAPSYLARMGTPETVDDLDRHNCLGFNFQRSRPVWPMKTGGRVIDRTVTGSFIANNGETVRRMAVAGVGLARLGDYHARADLQSGRLVEVLASADVGDEEQISALFVGGVGTSARIRIFLDFVIPRMRKALKASLE